MLVYYELTGTLETLSPLHIGSGEDGGVIDQPLLRDGLNRLIIPGTSIAGVVDGKVGLTKDLEKGQASSISVCDSTALTDPALEVFNRTSIDRRTGAVANHHLHSQEFIPRGCKFNFKAFTKVEEEGSSSDSLNQLQRLKELLVGGKVSIGKGGSNGKGLIRLNGARITRNELSTSGILEVLNDEAPAVAPRSDEAQLLDAHMASELEVTIPFCAEGALYSGVSMQDKAADIVPLTRTHAADCNQQQGKVIRFLLPATSIKGVFRSRAEFIARTITGTEVHDSFLDQITSSGLDAVNYLFGFSMPGETAAQRGALTFFDVESTDAVAEKDYSEIIGFRKFDKNVFERNEFYRKIDALNTQLKGSKDACGKPSKIDYVTRTAIDRFTGNALGGALYSILEPNVAWNPIRITLDLDFLKKVTSEKDKESNNDYFSAVALFILLLIDLSDGLIRFGARTAHGAGGVKVKRENIELAEIGDPARSLLAELNVEEQLLQGSLESALDSADFVAALDAVWKETIKSTVVGADNA